MPGLINYKDSLFIRQLYNDYYKALVLYGMKILDDNQAASEDIVQDVFSILWHKDLKFNSLVQLKVYLYNSVRNNCIDYLKHHHIELKYVDKVKRENPHFYVEDNKEEAFGEEIYRQLFEAIEPLTPRQLKVFLLAMDGKPNREIAKKLGISVDTVKTQKRRAKEYLKDNLSRETWLFLTFIFLNMK